MPSQIEVPDIPDFDIPGMTPYYELTPLPLWLTILQWAGLKLRDHKFEEELKRQFEPYKTVISEALAPIAAGYLLRLNIYVHDSGALEIPGGAIITDIGVGNEPADALAERYRIQTIGASIPVIPRDESSYIWISKKRDGKLYVSHIPSVARNGLERLAQREARRRNALGQLYTAIPASAYRQIALAEYWEDAHARAVHMVADLRERLDIASATQRLTALQKEANEIYIEHQRTMLELRLAEARAQNIARVLQIVDLIRGGLRLGQVCMSDDRPVTVSKMPDDNEKLLVQQGERITELTERNLKVTERWHVYVEELNKTSADVGRKFDDANVPVIPPPPLILD